MKHNIKDIQLIFQKDSHFNNKFQSIINKIKILTSLNIHKIIIIFIYLDLTFFKILQLILSIITMIKLLKNISYTIKNNIITLLIIMKKVNLKALIKDLIFLKSHIRPKKMILKALLIE
jgi:hypothetical protein